MAINAQLTIAGCSITQTRAKRVSQSSSGILPHGHQDRGRRGARIRVTGNARPPSGTATSTTRAIPRLLRRGRQRHHRGLPDRTLPSGPASTSASVSSALVERCSISGVLSGVQAREHSAGTCASAPSRISATALVRGWTVRADRGRQYVRRRPGRCGDPGLAGRCEEHGHQRRRPVRVLLGGSVQFSMADSTSATGDYALIARDDETSGAAALTSVSMTGSRRVAVEARACST